MTTTVGRETEIGSLVEDLIVLERDAIAAYDSTIERLAGGALGTQVAQFRKDHIQHLDVLNEMAAELGIDAPREGDAKQLLTTGKIALAQLMGDKAILKAMKTNEDKTVKAYERATNHPEAVEKSRAFFARALADEERHREWMERTAASL
ncbi:ferritin-like domain-containing protein [Jiella sonneratiae]|uniref:Ferritin-like domain-containing protein n=1 Tax=Jiella sonneratiae TaxID=2816856 RepID=A0ABS3J9V0_9HYPH|nr:ferritin-like domain-containing protein [Jiella sonneratiae]MBO0905306.1 ferritin-like domain-containing protein [Jiella sonneratiae]